jgi:transcription elongation factor Elf1
MESKAPRFVAPVLQFDRRQRNDGPPAGQPDRRRVQRRETVSGRRASDAMKMPCPHCGSSESAVCRSRGAIRAEEVRRQRECADCGRRFYTAERVDFAVLESDRDVAERLLQTLPRATWSNVDELFHKVWGQSIDGVYVKGDWNALQALLTEVRHQHPRPPAAASALQRAA